MTRLGINPARGQVTAAHPQPITLAMVTYLPDLTGYFERRLDVLRLALASLHTYTPQAHDVLVFDNASCPAVVDFLRQAQAEGQINFLLLSDRNIGKIDALRVLFNAAPGEIIAYSDDDILFSEDWLAASLEVLNAFPLAGMVSAGPVRNASGHAHASLDALAEAASRGASIPGLSAHRERRIPDSWEADWAASTGRDPQAHLDATRAARDLVFRLDRQALARPLEAIAGANHFQFVARKDFILQALPTGWTGKLMGSMIELDEAVDGLGHLRLSTLRRYTRHLGNALDGEALQSARALGLELTGGAPVARPPAGAARRKHPLLRLPGGRRVLMGLYKRLFAILYS